MTIFFRRAICIFVAAILPAALLFASAAETSKPVQKKRILHKRIIVKAGPSNFVKRTIVVNGKRRVITERIASFVTPHEKPTAGDLAGLKNTQDPLALQSNAAFIVDQTSSEVLFEKNSGVSLPIASITKLMTSLVVIESNPNMNEIIEITNDDLDKEKGTSSRLKIGAKLTRADMLHIALMSSENRAASALGRSYVGGLPAFVAAMNAKAAELGMTETHYVDSSGLSSHNVASARDLVKLIDAAYKHPLIREYSTDSKYIVNPSGHPLQYSTTNRLVANPTWDIGLQKTGYIAEAGRCLVMRAMIEGRAIVMVFLDSKGKYSRLADAGRIRKWLETVKPQA